MVDIPDIRIRILVPVQWKAASNYDEWLGTREAFTRVNIEYNIGKRKSGTESDGI